MKLGRLLSLALLLLLPGGLIAAQVPKIVFLAGEFEYHSRETLPAFAKNLEGDFRVNTMVLSRPEDEKLQTIPGLEELKTADLLVVFVRRMTLPAKELDQIKAYANSGRPIIGIRTASHAFENWKEWDHDVLGGNYHNHHGNKLKTKVGIVAEEKTHPILKGFEPFTSEGSLYKNVPLAEGSTPLLLGRVEGFPPEPVAWTHNYKGARVFYTSLGHPVDFQQSSFRTLLRNAISWGLNQELVRR